LVGGSVLGPSMQSPDKPLLQLANGEATLLAAQRLYA
jgi:hypothetical protein